MSNLIAKYVEKCLEVGLPDMAIRNCHAVGIDSIVLNLELEGTKKKSMYRVFVANHDLHGWDELYNEDGSYVLGVHNHRYDIGLHGLLGTLINYEVALYRYPTNLKYDSYLYEFKFESAINGEQAKLKLQGQRGVAWTTEHVLSQDSLIKMRAEDLHTVLVPKQGQYTAWLVQESEDRIESLFYSKIPNPQLNTDGLYQKMSVSDAEELLEQVLKCVK